MKARIAFAVLAAMAIAMMSAMSGLANAGTQSMGPSGGHNGDRPLDPGAFQLNQSVVFGDIVRVDNVAYGVYMDGSLFKLGSYTNEWGVSSYMYGAEKNAWVADVDWSDNLVLHQFRAGDKIRTEVILQSVDYSDTAVYTVRAGFSITYVPTNELLWSGTTFGGLWLDGPVDAYSAEINQLGMLLYGYNWDSDEFGDSKPGLYKLEFTLYATCSTPYDAAFSDIQMRNLVDLGYSGDDNFALKGYGVTAYSTYIIIELLA